MYRINEADRERNRKHELQEQHTRRHTYTRVHARTSVSTRYLSELLRSHDLHRYCSEYRYFALGTKSFRRLDVSAEILSRKPSILMGGRKN